MATTDESYHKSYQDALEAEIQRWRGYENALRKGDREAFMELMDMCRAYALEGNHAPNPFVFEPMIMSILLLQQKRLNQIEKKIRHKIAVRQSRTSKGHPTGEELADPQTRNH